jgi:hypothetical protein
LKIKSVLGYLMESKKCKECIIIKTAPTQKYCQTPIPLTYVDFYQRIGIKNSEYTYSVIFILTYKMWCIYNTIHSINCYANFFVQLKLKK